MNTTTIISGLHTCKPKNAPTIGQVKAFILEDRGDWMKVRNPDARKGEVGKHYRIVTATKTDYSDAHGNVSFNLELEQVEAPSEYQQAKQAMSQNAPETHEDGVQRDFDPILETRQHLMKACNLYNLCVDAVNNAIVPHLPEGARMSSEQLQSTLASIWIEASSRRSTDGVSWWSYIDRMPTTPIKSKQKAQPNDDDKPPF